ncbi:MAG: septum formation initiator family protein [Nitrospirota bacterium]
MRKRRLVFFTIVLLTFVYILVSLIFGEMGLLRYKELHNTKISMEREIKEIEKENEQLATHIRLLKEDPFFVEKHAREDFGLAKPDEYIFLYDR